MMGPPGGWRYPVSETVTIKALTPELLRTAIYEWRVQNSIAPGDIDADIDKFYCTQYPERCAPDAADNQWPAGTSPQDPMADRVLRWVVSMTDIRRVPQGGWSLASAKTAEARAEACAACHRNVDWPSNCAGCDNTVRAASAGVRSHRAQILPHTLRACQVFGWDCATAVHLAEGPLGIPADDPRRAMTPPHCWLHPKAQ